MNRWLLFLLSIVLLSGCRAPRAAQPPDGPHPRVLTYNVNWGGARPDLAADIIRRSGADIVCLQETTPQWEAYLRDTLRNDFRYMEFRESKGRMGGGLAFLAKVPVREVAYVPSDTGWFDGWIMWFDTVIGPVQAINVQLRPAVSDSGSWFRGYFTTGQDRLREMQRFFGSRESQTPTLVLGDFNDVESSPVIRWLEAQGLANALPQFDRYSPTWQWRSSVMTLNRRMDHILYSAELDCVAARVIPAGASDHFPVEAVISKAK